MGQIFNRNFVSKRVLEIFNSFVHFKLYTFFIRNLDQAIALKGS